MKVFVTLHCGSQKNYKKNIMKKIGIYQIKNVINGKSYIGKSVDIHSRKFQHKSALLKNKHHNSHLQASFNKHGEEAFRFRILKTFVNFS